MLQSVLQSRRVRASRHAPRSVVGQGDKPWRLLLLPRFTPLGGKCVPPNWRGGKLAPPLPPVYDGHMMPTQANADRAVAGALPTIGMGESRIAYRAGNWVYKIPRSTIDNDLNVDEFNNLNNADRDILTDNIRLPEVHLFDSNGTNVIAMQYVKGDPVGECYCTQDEECRDDCLPRDILSRIAGALDIYDLGYGNVLRDENGTYWVVDAEY